MNRLATLILVCACALVPAQARANDGGWWDWLWKWDQQMMGVSAEIHVLCLNDAGKRVRGCEEWFRHFLKPFIGKVDEIEHNFRVPDPRTNQLVGVDYKAIRHEVDFHFGYYRMHGNRYPPPDPPIGGSINAVKLMGVYRVHVNRWIAVGVGAGYLPVFGERFGLLSRAIGTVGLNIYPIKRWNAFAVRPQLNWIPKGFTAADFGDPTFQYSNKRERNYSIAVGFDVRRIGRIRGAGN